VYVYPRRPGVGIVPESPGGMIGFSELSGHWIFSDELLYEEIDEDCVRVALRKVTVPVEEAWGIVIA